MGVIVGMEAGQNDGYSTTGASTVTGPLLPGPNKTLPLFPGIPLSSSFNMNGLLGGFYGGCDYQFGNWVVGVEGDWSQMNKSGQSFLVNGGIAGVPLVVGVSPGGVPLVANPAQQFQTTEHWLATARGRLGYAVDKWLFFVSGGGAWARLESNFFNLQTLTAFNGNLQNDTRSGWTVGGGFDYAITSASLMPGWSLRVEYLYVNIPSYTTFTPGNGPGTGSGFTYTGLSTGKLTNNIVRVGLSYKFGNYAAAYR